MPLGWQLGTCSRAKHLMRGLPCTWVQHPGKLLGPLWPSSSHCRLQGQLIYPNRIMLMLDEPVIVRARTHQKSWLCGSAGKDEGDRLARAISQLVSARDCSSQTWLAKDVRSSRKLCLDVHIRWRSWISTGLAAATAARARVNRRRFMVAGLVCE